MDSGPDPLERPVAEVRDGKRTLILKNLDKVWWPEEGITKGDVLDHYHALADVVGPHLRGRPFTMLRFPDGIAGKHFFQKDLPSHAPEWLHVAPLPAGGRTIRFPVLDDELSLLWAVNMGCFDLNVWCARADLPERPDAVIFDLDPAPPAGFDEARQVALLIRDALASVDLRGYPRTSGSQRGLHVLVPIARRHTHGEARGARRGDRRRHCARASEARDDEVGEDRAQGGPDRREPERLRPHHGVGVLGAASPGCARRDAGDVGGARPAPRSDGVHDARRVRARAAPR